DSVSYTVGPPTVLVDPTDGVYGEFKWPYTLWTTIDSMSVTTAIVAGPNAGLSYLTIPDSVTQIRSIIYIYPGLDSLAMANASGTPPGKVWFDDQDGNDGYSPPPGAMNRCTVDRVAWLHQRARDHEGVTMADSSHWGVFNRVFQSRLLAQSLEASVKTSRLTLKELLLGQLNVLYANYLSPASDSFDSTETALIFSNGGELGCVMDMQAPPSDP
ncbi:MAG: hypothetical protein Q8K82_04790, partial [Gemmatimonadaceae bacterium]|nr:hypothetical protein [Gemmatimonadaceae bacterium]